MIHAVRMEQPLELAFLADPRSVHASRWLTFFARRGHHVSLLVGGDDPVAPQLLTDIAIHRYRRFGRLRLPYLSSLQGRSALRRVLRDVRPEILHAHFVSTYGWQARLSSFHPYVVTAWGSDLLAAPVRSVRARLWARATLAGADLVTAPSAHLEETAAAYGVRRDHLRRVPFGVDTTQFSPADADRGLLADAGIPNARIVFSPRAIRPVYRQHLVVGAAANLPADVVTVIPGRHADPDTLKNLREDVRRRGLELRVLIIDEIPERLMVELYRAAGVVVSVPTSDGLPASVLEAMACGTPVVIGDLPGPREAIGADMERLVLRGEDPLELARRIREVLEMSEDERRGVAATLRQRAIDHFDFRTSMLAMEQLYLQLRAAS